MIYYIILQFYNNIIMYLLIRTKLREIGIYAKKLISGPAIITDASIFLEVMKYGSEKLIKKWDKVKIQRGKKLKRRPRNVGG